MDQGQRRLRNVCDSAISRQMVEESRARSFQWPSTHD